MANARWLSKLECRDKMGNGVTVLQRPLGSLQEATDKELRPLFQEPSLFHFRWADTRHEIRTRGVLDEIHTNCGKARIKVVGSSRRHEFEIGKVEWSLLTVYRVNGVLDTIQINVLGEKGSLYMQTGGAKLYKVFRKNEEGRAPSPDVRRIMRVFNRNALTAAGLMC